MRPRAQVYGFLLVMGGLFACTQYKPASQRGIGTVSPASASQVSDLNGPPPKGLLLANDKFLPLGTPLKAKISFAGQVFEQSFTPTGKSTLIPLNSLPLGSGILTIEIFQEDKLRFIVKKSRVELKSLGNDSVIVDDCAVLLAPWDGKNNDGSCEWAITEG